MFLRATFQFLRQPAPHLLVALCAGTIFCTVGTASAVSTAFIDDFSVVKNGSLIFRDQFDDGVAPPSAPNFVNGTAASYFTRGIMNEAGGKARLDTTQAAIVSSIVTGQALRLEHAILFTNIDSLDLALGLKSNHTFSMRGLFDLTLPTQNLGFYGTRFNDAPTLNSSPNDLVALGVRRGTDGVNRIEVTRAGPGSFETFGNLVLDPNHDQILFDLTKGNVASDAVTGSFAYVDGGVVGPFTTYGATADIFRGENFTRSEFLFLEPTLAPVPEPATLFLVGSTLAGIGLASWRQRRRQQS